MTTPETGTIYGLVDPRTNEVHYVGQTTKPIEVRLAGHLAAPAPLVRAWIEALAFEGRTPRIVPIRESVPVGQLDEAEKEEIRGHAERGDILNVVGNDPGNARRRKISREEAKRRDAEEAAMNQAWRQASWRQVADQIREATGGPISPAGIPIREIPAAVWDMYRVYHEIDQRLKADLMDGYVLRPGFGVTVGGDTAEAQERRELLHRRELIEGNLHRYVRAYCSVFSRVDQDDRWGSREGIFGRGDQAYRHTFESPQGMARYLSLIPWAGRALDPWVALADHAGIDIREAAFAEWVTDDSETRRAVRLYQEAASPGYLGVRYQAWDTQIADFALALGAAHIPGFVVPALLASNLKDSLTKTAKDRQATKAMCQLLQDLDPCVLDTVYGRDRLAESDQALGLPAGTSAHVLAQIFGSEQKDPTDEVAKLLQRHTGAFDTADVPGYSGWEGIHISAMRAIVASFCSAGLFADADSSAREDMVHAVKRAWLPSDGALRDLDEFEGRIEGLRASKAP